MSNRNMLWSQVLVDELVRSGLEAVCIAPGSRSTPLTLAFAQHPHVKIYTHLDERSAGFFALGLAIASDKPVALVCTSGSATVNFFPAIVEAHESRVPLIVLTTDRPHELRHSGANQTIDQVKIFGEFALWAVDCALPEAKPSDLVIRNLRTTANRAYALANGHRKGVVHLNLPFRKPLEPIPVMEDVTELSAGAMARPNGMPSVVFPSVSTVPSDELIRELQATLEQGKQGIIVCGTQTLRTPDETLLQHLLAFSQAWQYPILADVVSGVRFSHEQIVGTYDAFLNGGNPFPEYDIDVVIRLGDLPTSQALSRYLDQLHPKHLIHIQPNGVWADDSHHVSTFIQADPTPIFQQCLPVQSRPSNFYRAYLALEQQTRQTLQQHIEGQPRFDGQVVFDAFDALPDGALVFLGNSLAIRHADLYAHASKKALRVYANRGASGIDGNTSTALGVAAALPDRPLVAILGDTTFYHDMNGLLAIQRCGVPITIVLLNNDGGGIFKRLPIRDFEPHFTNLFVMSHGLDFSHVAQLYGLTYHLNLERREFQRVLNQSLAMRQPCLIEVQTQIDADFEMHQQMMKLIGESIRNPQQA